MDSNIYVYYIKETKNESQVILERVTGSKDAAEIRVLELKYRGKTAFYTNGPIKRGAFI